jgi:hypothetical protein
MKKKSAAIGSMATRVNKKVEVFFVFAAFFLLLNCGAQITIQAVPDTNIWACIRNAYYILYINREAQNGTGSDFHQRKRQQTTRV